MREFGDRADGLHDALVVEVVGGYEEQRTEVRAALSQVTELPLEVTDIAETAALRYLQMQFQRSPRPHLIALLPHRALASMRQALGNTR